MHDVAIIGGGPGGLYAARELAGAGFDVVVCEEHERPGDPVHCTGVLAADAFNAFGLSRASILNPLSTATFFAPSGESVSYTTPATEALVVDRRVFDALLADEARTAGAAIRLGAKVNDLRVTSEGVAVDTSLGIVEARACILACGASYAMQQRLGLGRPQLHLQSAQMEIPVAHPRGVELYFGSRVAPKGFAWVVPVRRRDGDYARVGLMCERDAREHFERFMLAIGPRWQAAAAACGMTPRSKMLPLSPIPKTYGSRLLVVGDAAGLVKATTGGGIYYSLLSARLAADVLTGALQRDDLAEPVLSEYEELWRRQLGAELDAQMQLRRIAHDLADEEIDSLFELARTDGIMPIVRRTARFNEHRAFILSLLNHPPARRVLMRRLLGWGRSA